jgi:hypothetical protein
MDMLQMLLFFVSSIFQEYNVRLDQRQRPPEAGNATDQAALLTTQAVIQHLNTLMGIRYLYTGCPTSGVAQRAMREDAPHARGLSKARKL